MRCLQARRGVFYEYQARIGGREHGDSGSRIGRAVFPSLRPAAGTEPFVFLFEKHHHDKNQEKSILFPLIPQRRLQWAATNSSGRGSCGFLCCTYFHNTPKPEKLPEMCFSSSNLANYALDFIWRDFALLFPKTGPKKAERHSNTQICRRAVSIAPQEHPRGKMGIAVL